MVLGDRSLKRSFIAKAQEAQQLNQELLKLLHLRNIRSKVFQGFGRPLRPTTTLTSGG